MGLRELACVVQRVSDDIFSQRSARFPTHTPTTKEYYLLRSIFEEHFPSESALKTVPTVGCELHLMTPAVDREGCAFGLAKRQVVGAREWRTL